jgi:hypothetical protein
VVVAAAAYSWCCKLRRRWLSIGFGGGGGGCAGASETSGCDNSSAMSGEISRPAGFGGGAAARTGGRGGGGGGRRASPPATQCCWTVRIFALACAMCQWRQCADPNLYFGNDFWGGETAPHASSSSSSSSTTSSSSSNRLAPETRPTIAEAMLALSLLDLVGRSPPVVLEQNIKDAVVRRLTSWQCFSVAEGAILGMMQFAQHL